MATPAQRRLTTREIRRFGSGREAHFIADLTKIQTESYQAFLQEETPTEKPEPDEEDKEKAAEMMTAYKERPTLVLPGTGGAVSGTAVGDWLDDDGNPKYGDDENETGEAVESHEVRCGRVGMGPAFECGEKLRRAGRRGHPNVARRRRRRSPPKRPNRARRHPRMPPHHSHEVRMTREPEIVRDRREVAPAHRIFQPLDRDP